MNESEYTRRKIVPAITERGGVVTKKAAGPRQPVGMSDLLGCYRGRALAIEVKMPGQRRGLTPKQKATLEKWEAAGAVTGVVWKREDVEKMLDFIDASESLDNL